MEILALITAALIDNGSITMPSTVLDDQIKEAVIADAGDDAGYLAFSTNNGVFTISLD